MDCGHVLAGGGVVTDKAADYCKHGNRYGAQCTLCTVPPELEHWALHKAEREMELRDKVIEEAKAYVRVSDGKTPELVDAADDALVCAVENLIAAEGEVKP